MLWLGLLFSTIGIAASDFFCVNLSTIATILGMSESIAGVTFLAFGNGSPDVFSTFAAMTSHSGSLAIGELIGAAGFITAVVAGSMALVRPFKVAKKSFVRDVSFFIVAASFSMVFLADGHLNLWECAVMVGFYVFYVITVVVWHWYLTRKNRKREREIAARGHFQLPGNDDAEVENLIDEDDQRVTARGRALLTAPSADDFANLERGGSPILMPMVEDADDQTRDHWMAELSRSMRISRPQSGGRRNTLNPIRPSLVGALEFRAVLSSLQKSRSIQSIPINLRRYSDDPSYILSQEQNQHSDPSITHEDAESLDATSSSFLRPSASDKRSNANRARAISANGALGLEVEPNPLQRPPIPEIGFPDSSPPATARSYHAHDSTEGGRDQASPASIPSPQLSLSPQSGDFGYLATSPVPISSADKRSSADLLVPPGGAFSMLPDAHETSFTPYKDGISSPKGSTRSEPRLKAPQIKIPRPPRTQGSSPILPFPEYHDDPNFVHHSRAPSIRSESTFRQNIFGDAKEKPIRWWPYKVLPPPSVLASTLFPTLYTWHDRDIWEKLLGIVAAPSVLLLTITLPVVEVEKDDDVADSETGVPTLSNACSRTQSMTIAQASLDTPSTPCTRKAGAKAGLNTQFRSGLGGTEGSSNASDRGLGNQDGALHDNVELPPKPAPLELNQNSAQALANHFEPSKTSPASHKNWNRWLVATQIFTAPFFVVLLYWANTDPDLSGRRLLLFILISLIVSLVLLAILLMTTTVARPPRYRYLLCFLGFIVSISWISTIANEVVGVLKALGVILGISDAILGLTIFAVGNSLGDLVADITVARLGYPVMALSACFGGPMLNILLGIGLSGLFMTIKAGREKHQRHPNKPVKYKPYLIDVGDTLIISGITLLVTLLGLLVFVPLNKWRMDRKIGWGLMALWSASTIANVVVEILI